MGIQHEHRLDDEGKPAGGTTTGTGIAIEWQDGPLGRGKDRKEPNGAFVEDVIDAARGRLEHYQRETEFHCDENAQALAHLRKAQEVLGGDHAAEKVTEALAVAQAALEGDEREMAVGHLQAALDALAARTAAREARAVEGTHQP